MVLRSTSHQLGLNLLLAVRAQDPLLNIGFEFPSTAFHDACDWYWPYCLVGFQRARLSKNDLPGCTGSTHTDHLINMVL